MLKRPALLLLAGALLAAGYAQENPPPHDQAPAQPPGGLKQRDEPQSNSGLFNVPPGTHVLLSMINSVRSGQSQIGDRIYLETAFPVLSGNRIVIPQGSYVTGTVTDVKRPARGRRRGELQVRFDSLILPNGVTRNFDSGLGAIDARDPLKHEHDKITSSEGKGGDVATVGETTAAGAGLGSAIGVGTGHVLRGVGIGAGAGAAAGMIGILMARGPDATLNKGATVEMVLDRSLSFQPNELDFSNAPPHAALSEGGTPAPQKHRALTPRIPY